MGTGRPGFCCALHNPAVCVEPLGRTLSLSLSLTHTHTHARLFGRELLIRHEMDVPRHRPDVQPVHNDRGVGDEQEALACPPPARPDGSAGVRVVLRVLSVVLSHRWNSSKPTVESPSRSMSEWSIDLLWFQCGSPGTDVFACRVAQPSRGEWCVVTGSPRVHPHGGLSSLRWTGARHFRWPWPSTTQNAPRVARAWVGVGVREGSFVITLTS